MLFVACCVFDLLLVHSIIAVFVGHVRKIKNSRSNTTFDGDANSKCHLDPPDYSPGKSGYSPSTTYATRNLALSPIQRIELSPVPMRTVCSPIVAFEDNDSHIPLDYDFGLIADRRSQN